MSEPSEPKREWIWVRAQLRIEELNRAAIPENTRGPKDEAERLVLNRLLDLHNRGAFALKHRFKGITLAAYWLELGGLTFRGWAEAARLVNSEEYRAKEGEASR